MNRLIVNSNMPSFFHGPGRSFARHDSRLDPIVSTEMDGEVFCCPINMEDSGLLIHTLVEVDG